MVKKNYLFPVSVCVMWWGKRVKRGRGCRAQVCVKQRWEKGGDNGVFGLVYYKTTSFLHYKHSIKYLPSSEEDDDDDDTDAAAAAAAAAADDEGDEDDLSGDDCC